ncbi:hypothetical protein [[Eubacterium] cellulosolvens]
MEPIPQERSAEVRLSKLVRAPLAEVFAWCTDYSDLDPEIIGSKGSQTRRVISRDERRIVFVDTYSDSTIKARRAEVSLLPPNEWRAKFSGGRWEGIGVYKLSEAPNGTRLDIVFQMEKTIEGYTAEDLKQRANEVWDRYVTSIEESLQSER